MTFPHTVQRRLLDEHEAAAHLSISVSTLRRWRSERRGQGPPWHKLGGAVRYCITDLDAYIESCRRSPEPGGGR